ncbi:MAG: hypothetical protein JO189_31600 [Deltaproteobacteria bacterium]|nr:hypothetical protein [Deltaproteobacteria bacterium]
MPIVTAAQQLGAQTMVTHADAAINGGAAAMQILPANASRVTVFIFNVGANTARLGDANTAAAQGAPLPSNQGITIETTDPIYAYAASNTTLAILEAVRL